VGTIENLGRNKIFVQGEAGASNRHVLVTNQKVPVQDPGSRANPNPKTFSNFDQNHRTMASRTSASAGGPGAAAGSNNPNNNTSSSSNNMASQGMALWAKQSKCNAEFFALTYGALVAELLRDFEDDGSVTAELDRMGHSIGVRCIEEVLAKANYYNGSSGGGGGGAVPTQSFAADTPDLCALAFRMFLGLSMEAHRGGGGPETTAATAYTLVFTENPLATFVELPKEREGLEYSQLYAGMIRGMLEMLQFDVTATVTKTVLRGHEVNEITVELKQILQDGAGEDYHEE
jgi:trafficking protein particle complex subunit 3